MNERPIEWMSVYGESVGHKAGRFAVLALTAALAVLSLLSLQLVIFIAAVAAGIWFGWMQMHAFTEYEFCYFGDEVDVSVIYNRARRKKKMTFHMDNVEYMVKKVERQDVTKHFCNMANLGSIYTLVLNLNGKRTALVMESDPAFTKIVEMKRKLR